MTSIIRNYKTITNEKFKILKNSIYNVLNDNDYVYEQLDKQLHKTNLMYFTRANIKFISTFMTKQHEIIKKIAKISGIKVKEKGSDL